MAEGEGLEGRPRLLGFQLSQKRLDLCYQSGILVDRHEVFEVFDGLFCVAEPRVRETSVSICMVQ